ncbi:MAG TPA: hypothetical protein VJ835_03875 [Fimbriimonadaceae bacterium]|nr:hypothetical protein [Fimbriimonadaceae bacterium]
MHTDEKHDPLTDLGYERRDINPDIIFRATMAFFGFAFFSYIAGWAVLHYGFHYFNETKGVNNLTSTKIPPAPNPILQTNVSAKTDIRDMRNHENEALGTSGESETVKGANRISIEQAIKLSAERGAKLPGAPAAPAAPTEGVQP